ncbi:MAG TPA: type II toxin-antitoxin system VapC family toxin [Sporichthyaceae bacterium]
MRHYLETSAAAKLLVAEAETSALKAHLDGLPASDERMSSTLTETELRRMAVRLGLDQGLATDVLARFDLVDVPRAAFREAGILPGPHLRSVDALHLTMALRMAADVVIGYDRRLIAAARNLGLTVASPGT